MAMRLVIFGDKALLRKLHMLPDVTQRRVLRPAMLSAGSLVNRAAKNLCPVETGLLRKSIGVALVPQSKHRIPGGVIVDIGPRKGFVGMVGGKKRDPTKYAHLVEYGTRFHPARPFMRPAFDQTKEAVEALIRERLGSGIERAAKSL